MAASDTLRLLLDRATEDPSLAHEIPRLLEEDPPASRALVGILVDEALERFDPKRSPRLLGLALTGLAHGPLFTADALRVELPRIVAMLYERTGTRWTLKDRCFVLDALGTLGDPRLGDPRTCTDDWLDPGDCPVPTLLVRRFPVTVAEYAPFVDEGDSTTNPLSWDAQRRSPNHPVTGVSADAARAFCRWATGRWALPIPGGWIDLPTAAEWDALARRESLPSRGEGESASPDAGAEGHPTRPVGASPSDHVRGLWDLVGNVAERCTADTPDGADLFRGGRDGGAPPAERCGLRVVLRA